MEAVEWTRGEFGGEIGRRLQALTDQWLLPTPDANPALLEMFRERDRLPLTHKVPWAGEFAGKYLTHAALILAMTRDERLKAHLAKFVRDFIALQDDDGYLGPWPKAYRLGINGPAPNGGWIWDLWGHYHAILGLLTWHEVVGGDDDAVACAVRIGDMLVATFLGTGNRVYDAQAFPKNMAVYHGLLLLYKQTGDKRYLDLAREAEEDFAKPPAGDYVRAPLAGRKFHETPQPRWESLHAIQGIAERYFLDGGDDYKPAFSRLWWSMVEGDRHNHGGFTSAEMAIGDPYDIGPIETCCTVAWTAMTFDMLRLTGDSVIADELEFTLFNSGLGLMAPSGRWVTYDTPMEGRRAASAHAIVFQARPGTPELNCCSVNGPRIIAMIKEWALTKDADAVNVNYYGPCSLSFATGSGNRCTLTQVTDYPREPRVTIQVDVDAPEELTLSLRIPQWSDDTRVSVNGVPVDDVLPGRYLKLKRRWQSGDIVEIDFDFRIRYWTRGSGYDYVDFEDTWRVYGPQPADAPAPTEGDQLTKTVFFPRGMLHNGEATFGSRDVKTTYVTTIESERDTVLPVILSAAGQTRIIANGETVYEGLPQGYEHEISLRLARVEIPLRIGPNTIMISVVAFAGRGNFAVTIGSGDANTPYGLASLYRGPILLAFDHRYNVMDAESIPPLDARGSAFERVEPTITFAPWLQVKGRDIHGGELHLCDFASAGMTGNVYRTWLNVRGAEAAPFSARNLQRSWRP
jgi:DUF1680 family protein